MRRCSVLLFVLLLALPAWGNVVTGTHSGRVLNELTGQPIVGARIAIGTVWIGFTDSAGAFQSPPLQSGTYRRTVSSAGYFTKVYTITVIAGSNTNRNALLKPRTTATPTASPTASPTVTPTRTPTPGATATATAPPPATSTPTPTVTVPPTSTPTRTPTQTPTATVTPTRTPTVTPTATPVPIPTVTLTPSPIPTASVGASSLRSGRWSDPSMWSTGRIPMSGESVTISDGHQVIYDQADGLQVGSLLVRGALVFAGDRQTILRTGNTVCESTGSISHTWAAIAAPVGMRWLFLANPDSAVTGGGDVVNPFDVGLWVRGGCRLDIAGQPKTSWTRLGNQASAGATSITVLAATGWQVGDELAIAPTEPPTQTTERFPASVTRFDLVRIAAVNGLAITLDRPLAFSHPSVQVRPGVWYAAEVMNLTRTVSLEGALGRRAHAWIKNEQPVAHRVAYVSLRWMAPQKCAPTNDCQPLGQNDLIKTLGRYPLHFHKNGNFSTGTLVEGIVVRDFGSHAIVTHDSNGITLRDNVAYDGYADAFWWDSAGDFDRCEGCPRPAEPRGLQTLHNIAAKVTDIPAFRGFTLSGFFVGLQHGNIWRDNAAVGIMGNETCSGFKWPEFSHGMADFAGANVAHNTNCHGLFAWQNDSQAHVIRDFVAYHNRWSGILHGAYVNLYRYENLTLYANGDGSDGGSNIELHAMSQPPAPADEGGAPQQVWVNVYMDAAGRPWNVKTAAHALSGSQPVRFVSGTMTGASRANINLAATPSISGSLEDWLQVDAAVSFTGNRYWINDNVDPNSRIVDVGLRLTIWRRDQSARCPNGVPRPEWNSWVCPN